MTETAAKFTAAAANPAWWPRVLDVLARDYPEINDKVWSAAIGENADEQAARTEQGTRMTWTHSICPDCWAERNPGRTPARCGNEPETCCFCGAATTAGIYVRHDPRQLNCTHEEAGR